MPKEAEHAYNVTTPDRSSRVLEATREKDLTVVRKSIQKPSDSADTKFAIGGQAPSVFWAVSQWRSGGNGSFITTDDISSINSFSQVMCSITEIDANDIPFIASAGMAVYNVVPHDGGHVTVHWWVGWNDPLRIRLNYIIVP